MADNARPPLPQCVECTSKPGKNAHYGQKNGSAERCVSHVRKNDVLLVGKRCEQCHFRHPVMKKATPGNQKSTGQNSHCLFCTQSAEPGQFVPGGSATCVGCNSTKSSYGLFDRRPTHCARCAAPDMKDVLSRKCIKCRKKQCCFGTEKGKPTHCSECSEQGMWNVIDPMCELCCKVRPSYGLPDTKPKRCRTCATTDMVDLRNIMCSTCKTIRATYGFEKGYATHCVTCALTGMQNVKSRMCAVCDEVVPVFGFQDRKATHCSKCALPGMEDVKSRKCMICIRVRPVFGFEDQKPTHCYECALPGMQDVVHTMCTLCHDTRPSFGYEWNRPTHCASCKAADMIDVVNPNCIECGLVKPSYGLSGKVTHCATCALPGMESNNRKCEKCRQVYPTFGIQDQKPTHCQSCADSNMRDVINRFCIVCKTTRASFGITTPTHCKDCSTADMRDVVSRMCDECGIKHPSYGQMGSITPSHCAPCARKMGNLVRVLGVCDHGKSLQNCTGDYTCGSSLNGRSKEECYALAAFFLADLNVPSTGTICTAMERKIDFVPQNEFIRSGTISPDAVFQKLCIFYDGHYFHKKTTEPDMAKTQALIDMGYTVIRIRNGIPPLDIEGCRNIVIPISPLTRIPAAVWMAVTGSQCSRALDEQIKLAGNHLIDFFKTNQTPN